MSNRHTARTIALQVLYEWDFNKRGSERLPEVTAYIKEEFAPKFEDGGFIDELITQTVGHLSEIDKLITEFAPNWPVETITVVDRNVLRMGVYELKMSETVPSKVAINEAIELAKGFGGEASGRFVNGVLGAIYKDMVAKGEEKEVDKNPPNKKKEKTLESQPEAETEDVKE